MKYVIFPEFRNNRQQNGLFCKLRYLSKDCCFTVKGFQIKKFCDFVGLGEGRGGFLGAIDPPFCNMCPFWFMNKSFFDILNLLIFILINIIHAFLYIRRSSLENYTSNNTRQHDTTRVQHDTIRDNTTQHEYNTTQYETKPVKHG